MKAKQQTSVTLRKKVLSDKKRASLYLDFYPAIVDPDTGRPTRRKFLNSYVTIRPKTDLERQLNDERLTAANAERLKIEAAIQRGEYSKQQSSMFLCDYFQKYNESKDISVYNSCLQYVKEFEGDKKTRLTDVNDEFISVFREYLLTTKNRKNGKLLSQNTAAMYFIIFKSVLHKAFKERLIP